MARRRRYSGKRERVRVESALTQLEDVMKKQTKKLVLAKETVRNLEESGLGNAAGGLTTEWTGISCGDAPGFCNPRPTNTVSG